VTITGPLVMTELRCLPDTVDPRGPKGSEQRAARVRRMTVERGFRRIVTALSLGTVGVGLLFRG
jgi:hypothetical protein